MSKLTMCGEYKAKEQPNQGVNAGYQANALCSSQCVACSSA